MFIENNKSLILNAIKKHYKFKSDREFADFLGITPQNLSNWYNRNTYDIELLYTKCLDFNAEYLISGKGKELKDVNVTTQLQHPCNDSEIEALKSTIHAQKRTIDAQAETINLLKEKVENLSFRQYKDKDSKLPIAAEPEQLKIKK